MKKLYYQFRLELQFGGEVTNHHFRFRFLPLQEEGQNAYQMEYGTDPFGHLRRIPDYFGNQACVGEVNDPHSYLTAYSNGIVFRECVTPKAEKPHPMYRLPSSLTRTSVAMDVFYQEILEQYGRQICCDSLEFPLFLMERIFRVFSYVPGSTTVKTSASDAWERKQGVCQDMTHILIAFLRKAGYPARYIAGMVPGEGETHAWLEVSVKDRWIGLDPTHNTMVGDTFIKLSQGLDFADAAIDRGCFKGIVSQSQKILVKVE